MNYFLKSMVWVLVIDLFFVIIILWDYYMCFNIIYNKYNCFFWILVVYCKKKFEVLKNYLLYIVNVKLLYGFLIF